MVFAHDTEEALEGAAALVNTASEKELLPDAAALDAFRRRWGWTWDRARDGADLASVRALRGRLREMWEAGEAGEDRIVLQVNALLREGGALPQLVKHDRWDYHWHATPPAASLATRMAVEAALAIADVVRSKELGRLRRCQYPGCPHVFVDLSKNRSRRFCDAGCGNRSAVAAYRARKAGVAGKARRKARTRSGSRSRRRMPDVLRAGSSR